MVRGYKESGRSNLSAQFEVKQDLKFLTEGLSARLLFNTSRISSYDVSRKLNPYYYKMTNYDYLTGDYAIDIINPDDGSEYLIYDPGGKSITANMYIEAALNYNRDFGKHGVGGLLVYQLRNNLQPNAGSLQASLPYRNVGLSGRFTYAYNNRYLQSSTSVIMVPNASIKVNGSVSSLLPVWHGLFLMSLLGSI